MDDRDIETRERSIEVNKKNGTKESKSMHGNIVTSEKCAASLNNGKFAKSTERHNNNKKRRNEQKNKTQNRRKGASTSRKSEITLKFMGKDENIKILLKCYLLNGGRL